MLEPTLQTHNAHIQSYESYTTALNICNLTFLHWRNYVFQISIFYERGSGIWSKPKTWYSFRKDL
jgi:hypothetical protein